VHQLARLLSARLVLVLVSVTAASGALAGCGSEDPAPQSTVTVPAPEPSTTSSEPQGGDVKGRSHDVGTIVAVDGADDDLVLTLDRWTLTGVDDATLAKDGAPVVPHSGERFANQNAERTYRVPVAQDAVLVVNECQPPFTPGGTPGLSSRQAALDEFLAQPERKDQVVLLTYSVEGELVQLDTDPRCD
jgi:hypothetical protein